MSDGGWGKDGTVVKYSRPPHGTEADHLKEKELKRKLEELERIAIEKHNAEELLLRWQTVNLVLQAFGTFVWSHISDVDKEELVKYGMKNFRDIFTNKWGPRSAARTVARRVYGKFDEDLRCLGEQIFCSKQDIGDRQHLLAHPIIPDARVKAFLEDLGDGRPELQPMEIAVFQYLKQTTNTKANIEASRG